MKYTFIVFEGIDGSGKTTLINNIKNHIEQKKYFFTKEPGDTDFKLFLYSLLELLKDTEESLTEYLLFAAERTHHIKTKIIPAILNNKIIISDRFIDSSLVYQANCNKIFIEEIFKKTNYGILPSLTFFCKINPEIATQRITERKNNNFLDEKYKTKLEHLDKKYTKLYKNKKNVITLDMTKSLDELTRICITSIEEIHNKLA